jgi:error-prone DNA polymerase
MIALPEYAELHALSNFTFLRGASHPEELVARARALGYAALAITDECSLAGVVRAHIAARDSGLKLIVGAEFRIDDADSNVSTELSRTVPIRFALLAPDRAAYGDLSELITRGRRNAPKGQYRVTRADVAELGRRCLALWVAAAPAVAAEAAPTAVSTATWVAEVFPGRAWIAVELTLDGRDRERLAALETLSRQTGIPLVAATGAEMHERARKPLHDVLTAIRLGCTVAEAGFALAANGERHLRARERLAKLYPRALLDETLRIAARCTFSLDELRYEYPEEIVPAGETPAGYLRRLTEEGVARRFPRGVPASVRALIEHELALIAELRYEPYFLTVYDIVAFARSRGILCQGRGSAANSAVCYCLGITEVDPSRIDMLFERFMSKERNEPPDIDVDFEHERREEVIQYLYAKYGRERAALAATVISYRPKSAVRDVGKALGFSLDDVDRLAKNLQWWDGGRVDEARLREAGFDPDNPAIARLSAIVHTLLSFPRHLSQHVGGFVIARDRLSRLVPIENAAMPERTVIQWDKDDLDALGLLKVDVLALGMLSAIRKALGYLSARHGRPVTMSDIPPEDPKVYAMVQRADTAGVFQIESRAQMAMLPRLKPACFYDLVIEVALVRPGPIQGKMVHPYLRRRQGLEAVEYPSEQVRGVLARTLGVPIFQEQVIKLAMVAAGFTPGEADQLRRSMAAWKRKGGLEPFERRLADGMRARGYTPEFAARIFEQIKGFGEYGFPESHAASFALLAYVSAWLKCHEPAAFLCALLNSQPMGFYSPSQLVQDARRHGVDVRPVDVCVSAWDCVLEEKGVSTLFLEKGTDPFFAVRLGLRMASGLSHAGAERIVAARAQTPFADVTDLARRAKLDKRDLDALASADALRNLSGHRHRARWAAAGIEPAVPATHILRNTRITETAPLLRAPTEGEDILEDYAALGLTLRRHPLALLRAQLGARHYLSSAEVRSLPHGARCRTAGLVILRQRPSSARGVIFVTLEDEAGHVNLIVRQKVIERERRILLGARLLGVEGVVQREGLVLHVIAERLYDHSALIGELAAESRDFH